jgi:predicted acylesterase/phospholipase RssA
MRDRTNPAGAPAQTDGADPLALSLTLPGSASLGAFQAGALAALAVLITQLRSQGREVRLDAIGGASAGSIVMLLFAHCLLTGRDAPTFLRHAWVDEVDAELLRSGGRESPLAFDDLRDEIISFLRDTDEHPMGVHEPLPEPVLLHVSLTSMLGLVTPATISSGRSDLLTFADHVGRVLEPRHPIDDLFSPEGRSPLDAVIASASHPGAFPPRLFDRNGEDDHYRSHGVDPPPDDLRMWYTDGGLVESHPVGRILKAAQQHSGHRPGIRLHLVVDPRSSGPSGSDEWADADNEHGWLDGIRRALSILPTQALHDDLREIAERNGRIRRVRDLVDDLTEAGALDNRSEWERRIMQVADLDDQAIVDVDIISPLRLVTGDDGVTDLLAGDFIGAFGGFLSRDLRRNDFALGWASMEAWAAHGLLEHGVDQDGTDGIMAALDHARTDDWNDVRMAGDGVGQLDRGGRWQLALLAAQTGRVILGSALPSPAGPFRRWRSRDT